MMKAIRSLALYLVRNVGVVHKMYWRHTIGKNLSDIPKNFIFVSSMPKSASTFVLKILEAATGYKRVKVYFAQDNEKDLYLPSLVRNLSQPCVTQTHMRMTKTNLSLLNYFNIRPVVLVRNIYDVVPSLRDHYYHEPGADKIFRNTWRVLVTDQFFKLSEEDQYDFIIDMVIPWYMDFYVSWYTAKKADLIDTLWITYENLVDNTNDIVRDILAYYDIQLSKVEIEKAITGSAKTGARFNKGVKGRGEQLLTKDQVEKIKRLARYYPEVDFSLIGL